MKNKITLIIILFTILSLVSFGFTQQSEITPTPDWISQFYYPDDLQFGRFQNINNILSAYIGSGAASAYNDRPGFRASSIHEELFLIDGFPQMDPLTHRPYHRVNLDVIKEIRVQNGGVSAEYGDFRSTLIEVQTKEPGDRIEGTANFLYSTPGLKYFGPDMFGFDSPIVRPFVDPAFTPFEGNEFFPGWNALAANLPGSYINNSPAHLNNPMELYALWLWQHRSPDAIRELKRLEKEGIVQFNNNINPDDQVLFDNSTEPDYNGGFTLSGPLPFYKPFKFLFSYQTAKSIYANQTAENYRDQHFRFKLNYEIRPAMEISLIGFLADQTGEDGWNGSEITSWISDNPFRSAGFERRMWYPCGTVPLKQMRQILGVNVAHQINSRSKYHIDLSYHRTEYKSVMDWRNTVPHGDQGIKYLPTGYIGTTEEAEARATSGEPGWENWRDWAKIKIGDYWYDETPRGFGPAAFRDISGVGFIMAGGSYDTTRTQTKIYRLKTAFTHRLKNIHRFKTGLELQYLKLNLDHSATSFVLNDTNFKERSEAAPWKGTFFLEDAIEAGSWFAQIGLRADWMIQGNYPVLSGTGSEDNEIYSTYLREGFSSRIWDEVPNSRHTDFRISPRLAVIKKISEPAVIRFNYGHFYQWADLYNLYRIRYNTTKADRIARYGNPLLKPPHTVYYELEYHQSFLKHVNFSIAAYYKDIRDEITEVQYYPLSFEGDYYLKPENGFNRKIRGIEAMVALAPGLLPFTSGWIHASGFREQGESFGHDRYYEDPQVSPHPASNNIEPGIRPLLKLNVNFFTPENFGPSVGSFSLFGKMDLNLFYTWKQGALFTWNPANIPGIKNNIRWRPYSRWDLRLTKSLISSGTINSFFYIDVINLFNNKNMTPYENSWQDVTNNTGWVWENNVLFENQFQRYMESLDLNVMPDGKIEGADRPGDWKGDHLDLPDFTPWTFLEKRKIFFGIRIEF